MTLREARMTRVLTMRDLAEKAGVAPSTIYHIEHGHTSPQVRVIRKLAAALDVEPGEVAEFAAAMGLTPQREVTER